MSNETYQATDGSTRLVCCGQPPGSPQCVCDVPARSEESRQRNAAMKVTKSTTTTSAPPSPWTRGIAALRGEDPEAAERDRHQARERHQAAFEEYREAKLAAAKDRPDPPPRPWTLAIQRQRGAA